MLALVLLAVAFLAYSNGANDNFKGVASLYGSGAATYRTALAWATATTLAGSIGSVFLAHALLKAFSGRGLVPDHVAVSEPFLLAVALGAGATVMLATRTGFPVSTTHALTGAILGSGLVAVGSEVQLGLLSQQFLLPLVLSPVLAVAVGAAFYLVTPSLPPRGVDAVHFVSAGVVSFARGLNDTPKIAAPLLAVAALDIRWGMVLVSAAMAIGGLLNARRVAETMSRRITEMNPQQGLAANLATGALVISASRFGLPVSTTHVSVGAIAGIGAIVGRARLGVVAGIVLSWVVTLPCAAALGGLTYWIASRT